jgi:TonB family protein
MVVPLRLYLDGGNDRSTEAALVHTVDISPGGARLGGLRISLHPDEVITLQRRQNKARFRVIWTKQLGPGETRAGVESIAFIDNFWGLDLPTPAQKSPERRCSNPPSSDGGLHLEASLGIHRRWIAAVGSFLTLVVAGCLFLFVERAPSRGSASVAPPMKPVITLPAVSGDKIQKHDDGVRVIISRMAPGVNSEPRLQVVDAPQGRPIFPDAPHSNLIGKVKLRLVIGKTGRVKVIQILSGNPQLAAAAVQAVRLWRYTPHKLDGQAVEVETTVAIDFMGEDAVSIRFPSADCSALFNPSCNSKAQSDRPNAVRT